MVAQAVALEGVVMVRVFAVIVAAGVLCSGCVAQTVGAVAKTGAGVGVGAAKTGVKATGALVDAATPDGHTDNDHHKGDDDPHPFDAARDATADVDAAFLAAQASGKNVLLILGGNWCHDSRGLAEKFERPELARVIADSYERVWVDVGHRDRNLHVARRFGVPEIFGTPTVLIASPDGALLNRQSVHDWRTADSKPYDETLAYFKAYAPAMSAAE